VSLFVLETGGREWREWVYCCIFIVTAGAKCITDVSVRNLRRVPVAVGRGGGSKKSELRRCRRPLLVLITELHVRMITTVFITISRVGSLVKDATLYTMIGEVQVNKFNNNWGCEFFQEVLLHAPVGPLTLLILAILQGKFRIKRSQLHDRQERKLRQRQVRYPQLK
jgi:hypothetical protein